MKILHILILTISLQACASTKNLSASVTQSNNKRAPSSAHDEENLQKSFDFILSSENPSAEMLSFLNRLKRIYYRSELALKKFDDRLDKQDGSFDLFSMPEYQEALVMWELNHRMQDKISFVYSRLLDLRASSLTDTALRTTAKKVITDFIAELSAKNEHNQVIYHDLSQEIIQTAEEFKKDHPEIKPAMPKIAFRNMSEYVGSIVKTRKEMQELGAKEEAKSDDLSLEIEALKEAFPEVNEGRMPQSTQVYPSPGVQGNITGNNLPIGTWALTYDDGPHPTRTLKVLKNLNNYGIKATFFMLAKNAKAYPDVVDQLKGSGMLLANHSYSHPDLTKLGADALDREINQSTYAETEVFGYKPKFFRCPYGAGLHNQTIRQMIADQNMIHVFWNVDTLDWQDKNPASILARAMKQMKAHKRGIVLFHDIHPQSVEASRMLMDKTWQTVRWVTVQQAVDELNKQ